MRESSGNSSDLSMNWALDKASLKLTSIYTAISTAYLKARPYICEGCHEYHHELLVRPAKYDPPYYRKKAGQKHSPRCKYRSPQTYIETLAKKYRLNLQEKFIYFNPFRLFKVWNLTASLSEIAYFFRHTDTAFLVYFLGHMVKELELSSLHSHYQSYKLVSVDNLFQVALDQLIGYQDDIVKRVDGAKLNKCLAFLVGRVERIEKYDVKGYAIIHFQVTNEKKIEQTRNLHAFRLFVPIQYYDSVGNLDSLIGRLIGCFGVAEKKKNIGRSIYQMTLFSIKNQIVYLDFDQVKLPLEALEQPLEPHLDTNKIKEEIQRFIGGVWAGVFLEKQQLSDFFRFYYKNWLGQLKQEKPKVEHEKEAYRHFFNQRKEILRKLENQEKSKNYLQSSVEEKKATLKKNDTIINRSLLKFGWSRKLQQCKDELEAVQSELELCDLKLNEDRKKLRSSEIEWAKRKKAIEEFEEKMKKVDRLDSFEQGCKTLKGSENPLIFKLPVQHPYWDLLLTIAIIEGTDTIILRARVQWYRVEKNSWIPFDHPKQLEEIVIETCVDENQIPKKQVNRFYNRIGNEIKQRLILLGYAKEKLQCPRCGKDTRISFHKGTERMQAVCWDEHCRSEVPIRFDEAKAKA